MIEYVGAGASVSGTGSVSPAYPSGLAVGDVLFLICETSNEAVATPAGWTIATGSPVSSGTANTAAAVRVSVFWRAHNGTGTSVTVADPGNHVIAQVVAYRGVNNTTPIRQAVGTITTASSAAFTNFSQSIQVPNALLFAVAHPADIGQAQAPPTNTSSSFNFNVDGVVAPSVAPGLYTSAAGTVPQNGFPNSAALFGPGAQSTNSGNGGGIQTFARGPYLQNSTNFDLSKYLTNYDAATVATRAWWIGELQAAAEFEGFVRYSGYPLLKRRSYNAPVTQSAGYSRTHRFAQFNGNLFYAIDFTSSFGRVYKKSNVDDSFTQFYQTSQSGYGVRGMFVAGDYLFINAADRLLRSADGVTLSGNLRPSTVWSDTLHFSDGYLLGHTVNNNPGGPDLFYYSTNFGDTWESVAPNPADTINPLVLATYQNGYFVAVYLNGATYSATSPTGTWTVGASTFGYLSTSSSRFTAGKNKLYSYTENGSASFRSSIDQFRTNSAAAASTLYPRIFFFDGKHIVSSNEEIGVDVHFDDTSAITNRKYFLYSSESAYQGFRTENSIDYAGSEYPYRNVISFVNAVGPSASTLQIVEFDHVITKAVGTLTDSGAAGTTLTQNTRFDNSATFYTATVSAGAVNLSPALYSNTQTFYTATVTATAALTQDARFDNTNTFYAATVTAVAPGTTLTQNARFDNAQTFYTHSVATGPVTLSAARYDNAQTFYAATVVRGAVNLSPALYTNSQTFYGATLSTTIALSPSRFDNAQTFYTATVAAGVVTLQPALYNNAPTFYNATVVRGAVNLSPALYTNTQTFYTPVVSSGGSVLQPARFDNSSTFFTATLTVGPVTLQPALYANAQTFYAHNVVRGAVTLSPQRFDNQQTFFLHSAAAGAVTLSPQRFDNSQTYYQHSVAAGTATLTASLYQNSATFYTATVVRGAVTLSPQRFDNAQQFFTATLVTGGALTQTQRFDNQTTYYQHTLTAGPRTLSPSLVPSTTVFYQHSLAATNGLSAQRLDNSQTFYQHTLARGAVNLSPQRYDNAQTFYTHTLARGAVTLSPQRFDNTNTFYIHTLARGAVTLSPQRVDGTQTFYAHTAAATNTLSPQRFDSTQTFYAATLVRGATTLSPQRLESTSGFYGHVLASSITLQAQRVANSSAFYVASAQAFNQLSPGLYQDPDTFYAATSQTSISLLAPFLPSGQIFYPHVAINFSGVPSAYVVSVTMPQHVAAVPGYPNGVVVPEELVAASVLAQSRSVEVGV